MRNFLCVAAAAAALLTAQSASASLTTFQVYTGAYDVSTDGCGSLSEACTLTVNAPVGSVVLGAFLYTSTFSNGSLTGVGGTFGGAPVSYTSLGTNVPSCCDLTAGRADVTTAVKSVVDAGVGGAYNFAYTETSSTQDGAALVVIFSRPGAPVTTIALLDGFATVTGDTATISFATPLDPAAPGFRAEMRIGDGFSFDGGDPANPTDSGQVSTIRVNGSIMTENAGHCDDAIDSGCSNGNLITVGDDADPFSPLLPTVGQDHEKYNLIPFITNGDTQISIQTSNSSSDDNIFLAVFAVSGEARVTTDDVPEPFSLAMFAAGLAGLGVMRRRR